MGEDSKGRIAELSRQLKNVRAQLKRTRSPMEEGSVCEPDLCVKVVMVYVYSGHDLDAAAEFMVSQGHGKSKNLEEETLSCGVGISTDIHPYHSWTSD